MKNNQVNKANLLIYSGSLAVAVLFCLQFSVTTSPLYHLYGTDSAVFQIIGKYWAQGSLPYVDLWDHKGPLIFFVNCLGYLLIGDKTGVWLIQVFCLSFFLFYTYRTFNLYFKPLLSCALTVCALSWLGCTYMGGNLTEEYILPLLSANFYYTAVWLQQRQTDDAMPPYSTKQGFLLGIILAFAFMTRLTNALGACGVACGISFILISNKHWKNFFQCIGTFLCGFAVLSVPFIIYFAYHHALDDMMFGTLFYNFQYMSHAMPGNEVSFSDLYGKKILFAIMAVNCYGLLCSSLFLMIKDKGCRDFGIVWFLGTLFLSMWYFHSATYEHYRTIAVPFFPFLVISLVYMKRNYLPIVCSVLLALLISAPIIQTIRKQNNFVEYNHNLQSTNLLLIEKVQGIVPLEDKDSLMIYSCSPSIWLQAGIKPMYRNFSYPESQFAKSEKLKHEILKEYESGKAKWILCHGNNTLIQDILDKSYTRVYVFPEEPEYSIWKR